MNGERATRRIAAGIIALIAWYGLVTQLRASIALLGDPAAAAWEMLRFFTVIVNLIGALLFTAIAVGVRRAGAPFPLGGITLAVLLVGIVHFLLLRGLLELSGGAATADLVMHRIVPVLVPLFWLAFATKDGLRPRDPMWWALLPLLYFGYALLRGAIDGSYPYPFMNPGKIGWARTIGNGLLMAGGFLLAGGVLVRLDRRLADNR